MPNALILRARARRRGEPGPHICDTEELWYAHDYVPFEQGENFAFLGGQDWDPSQVTLPKHVTDALEILLITKDNLAGYHRELVEHFILEEKWGRWLGRWTAEEHLHAIALRNYLVVTREIDPTANEDVRVEHVMKGYRADTYSQIETLVFMALLRARARGVLPQSGRPDRRAGAGGLDRAGSPRTRSATRSSSPTWSRTAWGPTATRPSRRSRAAPRDLERRRRRHRRVQGQDCGRRRRRHLRRGRSCAK